MRTGELACALFFHCWRWYIQAVPSRSRNHCRAGASTDNPAQTEQRRSAWLFQRGEKGRPASLTDGVGVGEWGESENQMIVWLGGRTSFCGPSVEDRYVDCSSYRSNVAPSALTERKK